MGGVKKIVLSRAVRSLSPLGLVEENGKALRLEAPQGELVLLFPKGSLLPALLVSVVGVAAAPQGEELHALAEALNRMRPLSPVRAVVGPEEKGVVGLLLVQPLSPWGLLFPRSPAEAHLEALAKVRLLVEAVAGAWVQTARPLWGRA